MWVCDGSKADDPALAFDMPREIPIIAILSKKAHRLVKNGPFNGTMASKIVSLERLVHASSTTTTEAHTCSQPCDCRPREMGTLLEDVWNGRITSSTVLLRGLASLQNPTFYAMPASSEGLYSSKMCQ